MQKSAFIFDLDGVIVFTDRFHYQAWKRLADELGIFFDEQINNRLRGVSRMASLDSDAGIHAASYGGLWQCVVYGFGGLRMIGGNLRIRPNLPKAWQGLRYSFLWKGQTVSVSITRDTMTLKKEDNKEEIHLEVCGKKLILKDTLTVLLRAAG